jgi:hypothetical protein
VRGSHHSRDVRLSGENEVLSVRPILPGGRGAAVEDVQRRLLVLGYDLGRTGVDGVFLGQTREAVAAFQREHELSEDGIVGPETWAALVDSTFTLGDRMLYLRLPYFHGNDVQGAPGGAQLARLLVRPVRRHLRFVHRTGSARVPAQQRTAR